MKQEIDGDLTLSIFVGIAGRLRDKPDIARAIREEQRRVIYCRVLATENQELIAYFWKKLAEIEATEEELRNKVLKSRKK